MKKIFYLVVPVIITLSGCAAMMTTTTQYDPGQSSGYNPPPDSYPPPPNNAPQPGYGNPQPGYAVNYDNSPQTDQVFYDELSPYGQWVNYPDYGYVWVPNTGTDFTPYATNGYWIYSDYGWTWVSNYRWGWAPFHYGRWFYDDNYGWMWVPGHEWAPAWVTWASYGDYYCWAPLAPRVDIRTVSANRGWAPPANSWSVVPGRHFTQPNVSDYIVKTNYTVIHNITIINNVTNNYTINNRGPAGSGQANGTPVVYNRGPKINEVENVTNTRVQPVKINDNVRPGTQSVTNNQLLVYRPVIKQNAPQDNTKPAPRKIDNPRPINNPNSTNPNQQNTRPEVNQNPNQRPNNLPQQNPRPEPNQNPEQRPNNTQTQQGVNPNQNQRPNNQPQQHPQDLNPQVNQNPNQKPNNQPQGSQQQNGKPAPNQNQRPNNQPEVQPGRNNFWQMKIQPKQVKKIDTVKRNIPNRQ